MAGVDKSEAVKLPDGVRVFVGSRTFRGEIPGRFIASEHKLRQAAGVKAEAAVSTGASKSSKKGD